MPTDVLWVLILLSYWYLVKF